MVTEQHVRSTSKLTSPYLIVLVGPPGSGKSTWTRRHCSGAVVVSQDDLIEAITPDGFDPALRPVYAAAEEAIARAALLRAHNVIVDRTNRTRALRERWIRIAHETSAAPVAVLMSASPEACIQRNRDRVGPRRVSERRMERMLAAMEVPTLEEGFAVVVRDDAAISSIRELIELQSDDRSRCSYSKPFHAPNNPILNRRSPESHDEE